VTTAATPEDQDMTETSEDQRATAASDEDAQRTDAQQRNGGGERQSADGEQRPDDGEQLTADVDGDWMNLGPCHYDQEHDAAVVATREDGTGWIAVCEEHIDEAKQNGFEPNRSGS
jgi:hypothetical protein